MQPMLLCVALSVSLHAAVLAYRVTPSPALLSNPGARDVGGTAPGATRVRVIPERPRRTTAIAETADRRKPRHVVGSTALFPLAEAVVNPAGARTNTSKLGTSSQPVIEQTALASAADVQSRPDEDTPSADFDGSDYIPRSQLTISPSALTAIVLNTPEGEFSAERYVGVLSLFIDEEGHVKHVAAEGTRLPPMFEQVAREAFIAAPFLPGQLAGLNVKSRVRVEVVFDNRFK
ncbi:hypothetical protein [Variovorax beijingensis]|uniref:hypothetical protein n=1 Tax=Variovorax beijingensis TaxID=2496117 RepID=UPI0011A14ABA|nr:hypothetical protein [Variovorax beijingensis]